MSENKPHLYRIVWSTDDVSGELPDEYVGLETALKAGQAWEAKILSDDTESPRDCRWEVVRTDPAISFQPQHEETLHEHDR